MKERERWREKPRVEETLLKRVGIAVFCSRHALRVRLRLLPTNREINRHTAERQQTNEITDRTNERPLQTGYTLYEKKSIVNELLVLSFSLTHVANEHIDHPDTTPTVAGTQLKSRVARSTRFVRLRVLFAPPSSPLDPTDTMRFEQDRPICSSESGIRTCDNPKYGCFSANRTHRTLLHAFLRIVSRVGNLLSFFLRTFLVLFHSRT